MLPSQILLEVEIFKSNLYLIAQYYLDYYGDK